MLAINCQSKPILFVDDINIISHPEIDFQNLHKWLSASFNTWFEANQLTLNFDKTNFMKYYTTSKHSVGYEDKND